jgi:signal peptidase I
MYTAPDMEIIPNEGSEKMPVRKSFLRNLFENILYLGIAIVLALGVQHFIFRPFIVSGSSMDPTFKSKDYLIVDEISYRFHEPRRGDVIIFKAPPEPTKFYIKRVIGLPGETVKIEGTKVTIINKEHPDGMTLSENFITHPQIGSLTFTVPNDSYFVMGDNRAGSYDSREWGAVPAANIRGRAYLRLLPFNHISFLPGKETLYEGNQ